MLKILHERTGMETSRRSFEIYNNAFSEIFEASISLGQKNVKGKIKLEEKEA